MPNQILTFKNAIGVKGTLVFIDYNTNFYVMTNFFDGPVEEAQHYGKSTQKSLNELEENVNITLCVAHNNGLIK